MPKRGLLSRDELLRQFTALLGERRELCKQASIRADEVEAREYDGPERGRQKPVELPLHAVIDLTNALNRLLFAFIILDQKACHRGAQRRLPGLQRKPDLGSRIVLV